MDHPKDQEERAWCTPALALCVLVSFFGCLIGAGFNIAVLNAPQQLLMAECNASLSADFGVTLDAASLDLVWSSLVAVFLVGATAGSLLAGSVADLVGRRPSVLGTQLVLALSGALLCAGYEKRHMTLFFLGRVLAGLGTGMATAVCPLYIHEVAPARLQEPLGSITNLGIVVGLLSAQILGLPDVLGGREETVGILLAAFVLPTLLATVSIPFCPESPKYLLIRKHSERDAVKALSRLRGLPPEALEPELNSYRADCKLAAETERWSLARLLADPSTSGRLLLLVFFCAGQQLSGVNAVFYFSTSIFHRAGMTVREAALASLGCGAANLVMSLSAALLLTRCSARRLLTVSCLGCAGCLAGFAAALQLMERYPWATAAGISLLILYVLFFAMGFGPIPWMLGAQLFEQGPRPLAVSVGAGCNWAANFLVVLLFPMTYAHVGAACFALFVAFSLLAACVAHLWLPRTAPPPDPYPTPTKV